MTATPIVSAGPTPGRWELLRAPMSTMAGLAAASAALYVRDPHVQGSWGFCPSRLLFGIDCPGCGGLRAVNDLTHLDLAAAASSNLLFIASLPLVAALFGSWLRAAWRGERFQPSFLRSPRLGYLFLAVAVVFMVARNTPQGAWLHS